MIERLLKGTLVLINRTNDLNAKIDSFGGIMNLFGKMVREFHGKLMLTTSDESDGLCFMKKFTPEGWIEVFIEEGKPGTGRVPFPIITMNRVNDELFCSDNLEDVVLIKRKFWFESTFGRDLKQNNNNIENIDQLYRFHGKVLRTDWNETEKQTKGFRVLKKFTLSGWETIYIQEGRAESGYLLFPDAALDEFNSDTFFSEVNE